MTRFISLFCLVALTGCDSVRESGAQDAGPIAIEQNCSSYCDAYLNSNCGEFFEYYDSAIECETICSDWSEFPQGVAGATSGDSLACRIYHLGVAIGFGGATEHCDHSSQTGAEVCGSLCENFCRNAFKNCPVNDLGTFEECISTCDNTFVPDNSVECRLEKAIESGEVTNGNSPLCPDAVDINNSECIVPPDQA